MADSDQALPSERAEWPDGHRRLSGLHLRKTKGSLRLMRYRPKSPSERQEMMAAIGIQSVEELFHSIPASYRLKRPLQFPRPLSEMAIIDYFLPRPAHTT